MFLCTLLILHRNIHIPLSLYLQYSISIHSIYNLDKAQFRRCKLKRDYYCPFFVILHYLQPYNFRLCISILEFIKVILSWSQTTSSRWTSIKMSLINNHRITRRFQKLDQNFSQNFSLLLLILIDSLELLFKFAGLI